MNKPPTSYWSARQIRITGEGPDGALSIDLVKPYALIGTHQQSDLVLQGKRIARRHLYLHATDSGIYCVNLARARRNNALVGEWIKKEQTVQVGHYELQFGFVSEENMQADENSVDLLARKSAERPFPLMQFSVDNSLLGNRLLSRRLSIVGRDPSSSFQFVTRSMSPQHCVIYQHAGQIWVVDLKASSKTRLNGQPVKVARLADYSVLQMGRVGIYVQRTAQPVSVPRWKSEEDAAAISAVDLEQPIAQLPSPDSVLIDHLPDLHLSSDIHDSEVDLEFLLTDIELARGGSDVELQRDDNREVLDNLAGHENGFNSFEQETRQEIDVGEWEGRQPAGQEDLYRESNESDLKVELMLLREQLETERSRHAQLQSQWEQEVLRAAEEAAANAEWLEQQKAELAAAREKLDQDQRLFDRYVTVDLTQQQVLAKLGEMRREKKPGSFWSWLLGRQE